MNPIQFAGGVDREESTIIGSAFAAVATEPRGGVRCWSSVSAPLITLAALIFLFNGVRPVAVPTRDDVALLAVILGAMGFVAARDARVRRWWKSRRHR